MQSERDDEPDPMSRRLHLPLISVAGRTWSDAATEHGARGDCGGLVLWLWEAMGSPFAELSRPLRTQIDARLPAGSQGIEEIDGPRGRAAATLLTELLVLRFDRTTPAAARAGDLAVLTGAGGSVGLAHLGLYDGEGNVITLGGGGGDGVVVRRPHGELRRTRDAQGRRAAVTFWRARGI